MTKVCVEHSRVLIRKHPSGNFLPGFSGCSAGCVVKYEEDENNVHIVYETTDGTVTYDTLTTAESAELPNVSATMAFEIPPPPGPSSHGSRSIEKPRYSYPQLISQAIISDTLRQVTLSAIYSYITEKYPYYRPNDKRWQNSIRQTLSKNKSFVNKIRSLSAITASGVQVDRTKGGFWCINPASESEMIEKAFKPTNRGRQRYTIAIDRAHGKPAEDNSTGPPSHIKEGDKSSLYKDGQIHRPVLTSILTSLREGPNSTSITHNDSMKPVSVVESVPVVGCDSVQIECINYSTQPITEDVTNTQFDNRMHENISKETSKDILGSCDKTECSNVLLDLPHNHNGTVKDMHGNIAHIKTETVEQSDNKHIVFIETMQHDQLYTHKLDNGTVEQQDVAYHSSKHTGLDSIPRPCTSTMHGYDKDFELIRPDILSLDNNEVAAVSNTAISVEQSTRAKDSSNYPNIQKFMLENCLRKSPFKMANEHLVRTDTSPNDVWNSDIIAEQTSF